MTMDSFKFLLCIVVLGPALAYEPILKEISVGASYCNNDKFFRSFDLSSIAQFGATCNIEIPNTRQVSFLLENNVIPILCMGFYDVSLRSCKAAINDTKPFSEIFPPSPNKFEKLFNTLEDTKNFSSLEQFCSQTVKNFTISEPASNVTKPWWHILNAQLNDSNTCSSMCHTNGKDKVNPLCSYIIWSNAIYLNNLKSQAELQASSRPIDEDMNTVLEDKLEALKKAIEDDHDHILAPKPVASANENLAVFASTSENTIPEILPVVAQVEPVASVDTLPIKTTVGTKGNDKLSNILPDTIHASLPTDEIGKSMSNNIVEANISQAGSQIPVVSPIKTNKQVDEVNKNAVNKTSLPKINPTLPKEVVNEEKVPNSEPQSQGAKPNTEKTGEPMIESDFSFEATPEAVGQPIVGDKDTNYLEDEDGDDVDIPDGPMKTTPKKTVPGKPIVDKKQNLLPNDQVLAEPDKVYGEVEREILIEDHFIEAEDSHFFTYFLCLAVLVVLFYLAFYNKKKLVALAVEGRRTRSSRRRPNCSNYSKLDCSLEEAMVSNTTASVTHVLY